MLGLPGLRILDHKPGNFFGAAALSSPQDLPASPPARRICSKRAQTGAPRRLHLAEGLERKRLRSRPVAVPPLIMENRMGKSIESSIEATI